MIAGLKPSKHNLASSEVSPHRVCSRHFPEETLPTEYLAYFAAKAIFNWVCQEGRVSPNVC